MANLIQTETAVKTSILSSEDGEKTFSITKEVEGIGGGHAYFLLLYPTRTAENCYIEDSTNNHLLKENQKKNKSSKNGQRFALHCFHS